MAKEAILKIRETEARAEQIVADARRAAQAMLDEAKVNGQALCDATEAEAAKARKEAVAAAGKESETLRLRGERDALLEVEDLKKEAALKRKVAEKIVLRGLEEKCR